MTSIRPSARPGLNLVDVTATLLLSGDLRSRREQLRLDHPSDWPLDMALPKGPVVELQCDEGKGGCVCIWWTQLAEGEPIALDAGGRREGHRRLAQMGDGLVIAESLRARDLEIPWLCPQMLCNARYLRKPEGRAALNDLTEWLVLAGIVHGPASPRGRPKGSGRKLSIVRIAEAAKRLMDDPYGPQTPSMIEVAAELNVTTKTLREAWKQTRQPWTALIHTLQR